MRANVSSAVCTLLTPVFFLSIAFLGCLFSPGAGAAVIISSDPSQTGSMSASIADGSWTRAAGFTMTADKDHCGDVTLRLMFGSGATDATPRVQLFNDSSGEPGSVLITFVNPSLTYDNQFRTYTFAAPSEQALSDGSTYWIVVANTSSSDTFSWRAENNVTFTETSATDAGDAVNSGSGWSSQSIDYLYELTDTPTPIELVDFKAVNRVTCIQLEWVTAIELDTAGYRIWRSAHPNAGFLRITDSLILGLGGPTWGEKYCYRDFDLDLGQRYFYRLEIVEFSGGSCFHGPVSAVAGKPDAPFMIPDDK